jgi:hypothetical protein
MPKKVVKSKKASTSEGMVKLWCEEGEHHWYRESQRGRLPTNCPEHRPVPASNNGGSKTKKIKCKAGHTWRWPVRGGFPPKWCPEHHPNNQPKEIQFVDLHCELGNHTWSRPKTRGKPPKNCPLHHPSAKVATGLGAIKSRAVKSAQPAKPIQGLGKLRQRKRVGFKKLHDRHIQRLRDQAQANIDAAEKNYEQAFEEERAVFMQLDRLETMKLKTPKRLAKIDELREEWERKSRRVNNMYMTLQTNIAGTKRLRSTDNGRI